MPQKDIVEKLKTQWKRLWLERLDDKVRAEGVAINDYSCLFVEKGTVIHATRDYKAVTLRDILEKHQILNSDKYFPTNPTVGGWKKFVKTNISSHHSKKTKQKNFYSFTKSKQQQTRKSGRGWLHK